MLVQYYYSEEAEASPSIGNTLWRVWTVFTRSAITPPEVNRFGWNLGHCEYIVCRWPWQILGAIRYPRISENEPIFCFFCPVNNARLYRFPVGQFHEICTQDVDLRDGESFWKEIFKIFPQVVVFPKSQVFWYPRERLPTSDGDNSLTI